MSLNNEIELNEDDLIRIFTKKSSFKFCHNTFKYVLTDKIYDIFINNSPNFYFDILKVKGNVMSFLRYYMKTKSLEDLFNNCDLKRLLNSFFGENGNGQYCIRRILRLLLKEDRGENLEQIEFDELCLLFYFTIRRGNYLEIISDETKQKIFMRLLDIDEKGIIDFINRNTIPTSKTLNELNEYHKLKYR